MEEYADVGVIAQEQESLLINRHNWDFGKSSSSDMNLPVYSFGTTACSRVATRSWDHSRCALIREELGRHILEDRDLKSARPGERTAAHPWPRVVFWERGEATSFFRRYVFRVETASELDGYGGSKERLLVLILITQKRKRERKREKERKRNPFALRV